MSLILPVLCLTTVAAKIVSTTVTSNGPEIASQFCFPTVNLARDKAQLVSKPRLQNPASVSQCWKYCLVLKYGPYSMQMAARTGHSYYNLIEVNSEKQDVCVSVVVIRCEERMKATNTQMSLYIEYLNDGLSPWNTGLSLEDQGMPTLMCIYALAVSIISIVFWKLYFDVEKLNTHPDFLLLIRVCYVSLLLGVIGWASYYLLYVSSGSPSALIKSLACYSQWAFDLSVVSLMALHGTSHFLNDIEILTEVKVIVGIDAVLTFYLAILRALEDEEVVEFHWFCWSSMAKYLRLFMALVLFLWNLKGYQERDPKHKELFALMAYAGLLWACAQPLGIWASKFMLRFRWKFYQCFFSMTADVLFAGWFLMFLQPKRAGDLFARENSAQALKYQQESV